MHFFVSNNIFLKKIISILVLSSCVYTNSIALHSLAPVSDTIPEIKGTQIINQMIVPASVFFSGAAFASISALQSIENSISNGFNPSRKFTRIDNYLQYAPGAAVFAIDAMGFKGKYAPKQQIILYAFSNITAAAIVQPMKRIVHRARPNHSNNHAFPSGPTSTAFVAAEILHQEFGHRSPWFSIAGYTVAATTGYLRMYNNEHRLGDVLAGAAIGMASTKLCYWLVPKILKRR